MARKKRTPPAVRASISFPPELYEALEGIAEDKKVSMAWVVRDAVEAYVANETDQDNRNLSSARSKRTP